MIKFLKNKKNILALMSEREDGSMKLFRDNRNKRNRDNFFRKIKVDRKNVISAEIVHGSKVGIVTKKSPKIIKGADALVTKENLFLTVTIADCIPVYFCDEKNKIIGLAHAGWRGIVSGIIKNTLDKFLKIGGDVTKIKIILGPGIKKCHFEIKDDILINFNNYREFIFQRNGKIKIDLFEIIQKQLLDLGVKNRNIFISKECTFENKRRYFSYRRDKPMQIEAMMAIIGMR